MATLTVSKSFSMLAAMDWNWEVTSYSATSVVISDGIHKQTFTGNFSFSNAGVVSGTVTQTRYYDSNGSSLAYTLGNTSLSASQLQVFAETYGDTQQTYAFALSGNDTVTGSSGSDTLLGYGGNDTISAGMGADELRGGDGNDVLVGGAGNDKLTGNAGSDFFRFETAPGTSNIDTVTDFNTVDTLQFAKSVFTAFSATGAISAANYVEGTNVAAKDANDFLLYDTGTGKLFYDRDGTGSAAPVQVALLGVATHPGANDIGPADFVIV